MAVGVITTSSGCSCAEHEAEHGDEILFDEDTEVDGKSALLTPRLNSRRALFAQLELDAGWDELDCELCGNAFLVVSSAAIGIEAALPVPTNTCWFDANTTAPCQLPSRSLLARASCQKSLMTWCRPPSRKAWVSRSGSKVDGSWMMAHS